MLVALAANEPRPQVLPAAGTTRGETPHLFFASLPRARQ